MDKKQTLVSCDNQTIKNEIANKNAIELTSTNAEAVATRLKNIDILGVAIKSALVEGINDDYAVIPNTSKPALLLPGARKICMLYGLTAQYPVMDIKDTLVLTKCELYLNGVRVSESYGSCAINKTNRDIGWEQNKAIKIAQKRAMVGATLQVANLSKVFTQDTEDMPQAKEYTEDQKKNTYEVCNKWKQIKGVKCFGKAQFKQAWNNFVQDVKGIMGLDNAYELGTSKELAEQFLSKLQQPKLVEDKNSELGVKVVGALPNDTEEVDLDNLIANYGKKGK